MYKLGPRRTDKDDFKHDEKKGAWIIFAEKLSLINGIAFFVVLTGIYFAQFGQGVEKMNINPGEGNL